ANYVTGGERPQDGNGRRIHRVDLFFFQAEDGIRDRNVTGVQTCALPILNTGLPPRSTDVRRQRQPTPTTSAPVCSTRLVRRFRVEPVDTRSSISSTWVSGRISFWNSTGSVTLRCPLTRPLIPYTTIGRDGCARATQCERMSAPGPVESTTSTGQGAKCLAMTAPRPSVNDGSVVTRVFSMYSLVWWPEGRRT